MSPQNTLFLPGAGFHCSFPFCLLIKGKYSSPAQHNRGIKELLIFLSMATSSFSYCSFFYRSWGLQLTPCCTWCCMWSEMDPTEAHSLGDNVGLQRTDLPKLHNASVPEQGLRCGLCVGWFSDGCRGPVVLLLAAGARLFLCLHTLSFPTLGHPAQQSGIFYVNYWLTVGRVDVIYMNKNGGKMS